MSLPWAIQEIHLPAEETKGQQRRSIFNEDPWALRKCHQCHENFIPTPANNDFDFCSGDCRLSCSILRHTKKQQRSQQQQGRKKK
ncbi:unnamed protein product [Ectocarpus sp. 8 AP-2014]